MGAVGFGKRGKAFSVQNGECRKGWGEIEPGRPEGRAAFSASEQLERGWEPENASRRLAVSAKAGAGSGLFP